MTRQSYQPHEIPKQITATLYLTYGVGQWNRGQIGITDYWNDEEKIRKSRYERDCERVLLAEFSVTIDIPEGVDPRKRYVEVLKNERRKLMAKHHVELKSVDDAIQKAQAIEFQPKA